MRQVQIYSLADPFTGEIKYVGKTTQQLKTRLSSHRCFSHSNSTKSWVFGLEQKGSIPKIELITKVDLEQGDTEEKFYISYFKFLGFSLLNKSEGGLGTVGLRWNRTEKSKFNYEKGWRDRKYDLAIFKGNGELIKIVDNYYQACEFLNASLKTAFKSFHKGSLINKMYYLLKSNDERLVAIKENKVKKNCKIKFTNIVSNEVSRFNTAKEASEKLDINRATISQALKQNELLKNNLKVEYDFDMC